jgi:hypothetical protein
MPVHSCTDHCVFSGRLSRKLLAAEKKIASYDSKLADADKKIEVKNTLINVRVALC